MPSIPLFLATGLFVAVNSVRVWTVEGATPADRAGASVSFLGDLDGDGAPEIVFGAPRAPHPDSGEPTGEVHVLSGLTGTTLMVRRGGEAYDAFGSAVCGAGDLNGDGWDDVLVGSPAGTPPSGSVHALSGRDGSTLWIRAGKAAGERFGHALARVADVDGDGRPDVLVGAPHADTDGWNSGRVELCSGADGSLLRGFVGATGDFLGLALCSLSDVNGDGAGDLVLGAPFADTEAFNGGSVHVVSGLDGTILFSVHGDQPGDLLGHALAPAGDVNADGLPDAALVAPGQDEGYVDAGAVRVVSGADGATLLVAGAGGPGLYLSAAAGPGDLDFDGCADVALGIAAADTPAGSEAGLVRVVSGRTGCTLLEIHGRKTREWFGAALAGPGDVDGDGRVELLVGVPVHDDELRRPGSIELIRPTALSGCR